MPVARKELLLWSPDCNQTALKQPERLQAKLVDRITSKVEFAEPAAAYALCSSRFKTRTRCSSS